MRTIPTLEPWPEFGKQTTWSSSKPGVAALYATALAEFCKNRAGMSSEEAKEVLEHLKELREHARLYRTDFVLVKST